MADRARYGLLCGTALAACLVGPAARSQEVKSKTPTSAVEDVIVTSQRRSERLQKVPLNVVALSGATLARRNINSGTDLENLVPGLELLTFGPITDIFIRGVGNSNNNVYADPDVVFNIDGVALALPNGPDGLFYDIARLEVLKGPQGTFYGRNATSGVVNVITRDPTPTFGGSEEVQVGNYGFLQNQGTLNGALAEHLDGRVAYQYTRHDGYLSNGTDDADDVAGRAKLLWTPNENLTVRFGGDYYHQGGRGNNNVPLTLNGQYFTNPSNPWQLNEFYPNNAPPGLGSTNTGGILDLIRNNSFNDNHEFSFFSQIDYNLGFATLTALPAFREMRQNFLTYNSGFGFAQEENDQSASLELRLGSNNEPSDRLRWTVGTYILNENLPNYSQIQQSFQPVGSKIPQGYQIVSTPYDHTESYALFAQATYAVQPWLRLTGGVRWTQDSKAERGNLTSYYPAGFALPFPTFPAYPVRSQVASDRDTWKVGIDADIGPNVLGYGNIATGYKVGGFTSGNPSIPFSTYRPEDLLAYDVGFKSQFLDHTLTVNAEAFYWIYKNQQINTIFFVNVPSGLSLFPTDANAGHGDDEGVDLDVLWRATPNDTVTASVEYLNANYLTFSYPFIVAANIIDNNGKPFNYAPHWSGNLGYTHTFPFENGGNLAASVNTHLVTTQWVGYSYIPGSQLQSGYSKTDINVTYSAPGGRWYVGGWAKNLENVAVKTNAEQDLPGSTTDNTGGALQWVGLQPPRTFGFTAGIRF